jgi:hypothetical protein
METLYKIQVGKRKLAGIYDLMEAEKITSRIMHCVKDEIKMIPLEEEELRLQVVNGGKAHGKGA